MPEVSVTPKPGGSQDGFPLSIADLRMMTLHAAQFNPETVGKFMQLSVDKLVQKLEANKTQYFTFEGQVTDERVTEDHAIQVKAASELASLGMDMMGLRQRVSGDKPSVPSVNIDLSGWTVQPPTPPAT